MTIKSIETNEFVQGLLDKYGLQERKANSLGRQILSHHGYFTHKLNNFNSEIIKDVKYDMGIDEAFFRSDIPEDDPLKLRKLKSHYEDTSITIDYKSNNFSGDNNSIYVKLKPYYHPNKYFVHTKKEEKIDPIDKYLHTPLAERYYGNHQILSRENKSDLMIYLKYQKYTDYYELFQAYLIGRETLREQVINILNQILKKAEYPAITNNERSLTINQKITKAYLIVQEDPTILEEDIELFNIRDIMLKIPERYLNSYIKVDEDGEIIFSDITDY